MWIYFNWIHFFEPIRIEPKPDPSLDYISVVCIVRAQFLLCELTAATLASLSFPERDNLPPSVMSSPCSPRASLESTSATISPERDELPLLPPSFP